MIRAYRDLLREYPRNRVPPDCAQTQTNLSLALWRLGEWESGIAWLEAAVAAYRVALQEITHDRVCLLYTSPSPRDS